MTYLTHYLILFNGVALSDSSLVLSFDCSVINPRMHREGYSTWFCHSSVCLLPRSLPRENKNSDTNSFIYTLA